MSKPIGTDDLTVTMQASDRSKAIAAIGRALDLLGTDMLGEAKTTLRTALAELSSVSCANLKGQEDE